MGRVDIVDRVGQRVDKQARGWTDLTTGTIHLSGSKALLDELRREWELAQQHGETQDRFIAALVRKWPNRRDQGAKPLRHAVADGDFMACPACFQIQPRIARQRRAKCILCGQTFRIRYGANLARIGFETAYYGWLYRAAHEADQRRKKRRAFLLPEPGQFLWALGTFIVLAIASGLTWDLIKVLARRIQTRYKKRSGSAILKDGEAIRELGTLYAWANEYVREEFPGRKLEGTLAKEVRVRSVSSGPRILEITVTAQAPGSTWHKSPSPAVRQLRGKGPRQRQARRR